MDKIDIKILEILQNDGRASASDIAKKVKLSIPSVSDRIRKLNETTINNYTAVLDHKKANLDMTAFIFIVSEHSDHYDQFVKKTKETKEILECHSVTGRGSHILKIRVKILKPSKIFYTKYKTGLGYHALSLMLSYPPIKKLQRLI